MQSEEILFQRKGTLFACISPQMGISFGHWRLQATTAHLGALLRTQDEKKHHATRLILAFHKGTSEVLNVLVLGISLLLSEESISEDGRTVHYWLRF